MCLSVLYLLQSIYHRRRRSLPTFTGQAPLCSNLAAPSSPLLHSHFHPLAPPVSRTSALCFCLNDTDPSLRPRPYRDPLLLLSTPLPPVMDPVLTTYAPAPAYTALSLPSPPPYSPSIRDSTHLLLYTSSVPSPSPPPALTPAQHLPLGDLLPLLLPPHRPLVRPLSRRNRRSARSEFRDWRPVRWEMFACRERGDGEVEEGDGVDFDEL